MNGIEENLSGIARFFWKSGMTHNGSVVFFYLFQLKEIGVSFFEENGKVFVGRDFYEIVGNGEDEVLFHG
jgi:hypothetical protein